MVEPFKTIPHSQIPHAVLVADSDGRVLSADEIVRRLNSTLPQPAGELGEREAFERWIEIEMPSLKENITTWGDGQIDIHARHIAWVAWQASRLPTTTVGDDWVLVPREPTEAMVIPGATDFADMVGEPYAQSHWRHFANEAKRIYRAMIAAAPASPAPLADHTKIFRRNAGNFKAYDIEDQRKNNRRSSDTPPPVSDDWARKAAEEIRREKKEK